MNKLYIIAGIVFLVGLTFATTVPSFMFLNQPKTPSMFSK